MGTMKMAAGVVETKGTRMRGRAPRRRCGATGEQTRYDLKLPGGHQLKISRSATP